MAGIKMTHIPYKGSAPALTDLIGGHVALYFSSLPPAIGLVREGKVRALAVTGPTRSKVFPDLPTVAEAALPGFEAVLHYGIVAPAGTPRPVIDKLNAAMRAALASPDVQARIDTDGAEALASTPEQYAADIDREETKWSDIVRRSGQRRSRFWPELPSGFDESKLSAVIAGWPRRLVRRSQHPASSRRSKTRPGQVYSPVSRALRPCSSRQTRPDELRIHRRAETVRGRGAQVRAGEPRDGCARARPQSALSLRRRQR